MEIDPAAAAGRSEFLGMTYFFLLGFVSTEVRRSDPHRYLSGGARPPSADHEPVIGGLYTCPMHPEIVRDKPGSCPICGMALEPMVATGDETNPELEDMSRRFWVCLALSAPLLLMAMSEMIPGQPLAHLFSGRAALWIELALATPVVLWGGLPFFARGWASIVNRSLNMFTLIAIGTGAAYLTSVVATLFPGIFPDTFRGHGGEVPVYFEAAAVITTWSSWDRCSSSEPAAGRRAPSRRFLAWPRRRHGGSWMTAGRKTSRSTWCRSAIGCASAREKRCRSTASSSKARVLWMSRW